MDSLGDLFRNLGNSLELEELLSVFDRDLRCHIVYDTLSVLAPDREGYVPIFAAGAPYYQETLFVQTRDGATALATALREHRPVLHTRTGQMNHPESILIFPLRDPSAEPTATPPVLTLHRRSGLAFSDADTGILNLIAAKLLACIDNAIRYSRAQQIAESDPLTGLANIRSLFQRLDAELARARRRRDTLAVLQCSIEGFDRSGRFCSPAAACSAFERVAHGLREHCREYDILARSVDDLVLVLPGFRVEYLDEKCASLRSIVEECGVEAGFPLFALVGAAFFPEDGADAEDLLIAAGARLVTARALANSAGDKMSQTLPPHASH